MSDDITHVDVADIGCDPQCPSNEENEMAGPTPRSQEIDAQVDKFQQDNLAVVSATMLQTGSRFNDGASFVAQESKQGFLQMSQLVMTQNANNLEKHGLVDTGQQMNYERRRGGSQTDVNE